MDITTELNDDFGHHLNRDFSVPSVKCQTLLGKAIQEHFTHPRQVACVFSSSPSLQNSSAGANFLTNFRIDGESVQLVKTVFTPKKCYSVQFTPQMRIYDGYQPALSAEIFNFLKNNIEMTKYFPVSLRSLAISSDIITDEQLIFILSHLKRITKLELEALPDNITSSGIIRGIPNLKELEELIIKHSGAITASSLQVISSKLKLSTLVLSKCRSLDTEAVLVISKMSSVTSLSLLECPRVVSSDLKHVTSMQSLRELRVTGGAFSDETLQDCSKLHQLRKLDLSNNYLLSNEGLKHLSSLMTLESLTLSDNSAISDEGLHHVCSLKKLQVLVISRTQVSDDGLAEICSSVLHLQKLGLSLCNALTDASLEHLKRLPKLVDLDLFVAGNFSIRSAFSFLQATTPGIKRFINSGAFQTISQVSSEIPRFLDWREFADDADVSLVVNLLGDECALRVQTINFSHSAITESSISLISAKMKNLTSLTLPCTKINFENLHIINNNNNNNKNSSGENSTNILHSLPFLTAIDVSGTSVNDNGIEKIVSAFPRLTTLEAASASNITDSALQHLSRLQHLSTLNIYNISTSALHAFVMTGKSTLKNLFHLSSYARAASDFLSDPSKNVLKWKGASNHGQLTNEEVSFLLELVGDKKCPEIEEINALENPDHLTGTCLDVISEKCKQLKKIVFTTSEGISAEDIEKFKSKVPNCEVVVCEPEPIEDDIWSSWNR